MAATINRAFKDIAPGIYWWRTHHADDQPLIVKVWEALGDGSYTKEVRVISTVPPYVKSRDLMKGLFTPIPHVYTCAEWAMTLDSRP